MCSLGWQRFGCNGMRCGRIYRECNFHKFRGHSSFLFCHLFEGLDGNDGDIKEKIRQKKQGANDVATLLLVNAFEEPFQLPKVKISSLARVRCHRRCFYYTAAKIP